MRRRSFLAALASAPLLSLPFSARAQGPRHALKSISRDSTGTTLWLGLEHAPFPTPAGGYTDDTVIVFVPAHFRYWREEGVSVLLHFHGHNSTADHAIVSHQLREQIVDSKQNALLVVPQLAVMSADSSCGKLESQGGLARLVEETVATTAHEARSTLGEAGFSASAPLGTICISAHSGGYHAASCCLRSGGLDVRETYLFDALYSDLDVFRDWVVARKGQSSRSRHKLVSFFTEGGPTEANDTLLRSQLESSGVRCASEMQEGEISRHQLSHADAVFIHSGSWHSNVTWETNALRDCLFASLLPRHLPSTWFSRKAEPREVERRR